MGLPIVAILGRPNVGKSTLFNRLSRTRKAVIDDIPGVTRDRNYAKVDWAGRDFVIIDTGGLTFDAKDGLELTITKQAEIAAHEADLVLFLIEVNVTPEDAAIAKKLRECGFPVMLVVNKADNEQQETALADAWKLGLDEPIPISALNGRNVGDLLDIVVERLPESGKGEEKHSEIRVAVVGKPNVGKSSFVNRLLGEEKLVVHDVPGTTRDAIDTAFTYNRRQWVITDTAGLLREQHGIEYYSSLRTVASIKRSDIVLLLTDSTGRFGMQDKRIAGMAVDFYKGLVIGLNKWDLIEATDKTAAEYERLIHEEAAFVAFAPMITLSALTGLRVQKTLQLLEKTADERNKRIQTSEINRVVAVATAKQPPPVVKGKRANILYATQEGVNPPIFVFFCRGAKYIPENYKRYLINIFRREFGFEGVSLKLVFRERKKR